MFARIQTWVWSVGLIALWAAPLWAAAEGGGGHEISPNPFAPEWWKGDLALWTLVVFLVLLAILTKFAWKPILEGLQKRESGIAQQIADAEEANRNAKQLLADYEKKLADAREEVRLMIEQARRDAEKAGHILMDKAKADAEAEQQRALRQIEAATTSALKEIADRAATLAVDLAGKIVQAKLNRKDHEQLIQAAVNEFAGRN